jgi:uncharacterized membrane protein
MFHVKHKENYMNTKTSMIVIAGLILLGIIVSALAYPLLPEQVASHWGINDQPDGFTSRFWGVALMPLVTIGMALLLLAIPAIDPLKANIEQFRGYLNAFIVLLVAFMLYIHGLTLAYNLGYPVRMSLGMIPTMGLLFVFIGILMGKAKRNYFIGIRTPWTLANDQVWEQTHQLGSKLFIGAGVLSLASLLFGENGFWLMMGLILSAAFIPVIYSYFAWKRLEKSL